MREEAIAPAQDRRHRLARGDLIDDRLEPSLDTAEQLVVFLALIVRLMRLALDAAARVDRKYGVPPPPIPAVTGEIRIDLEVIPAGGERRPIRQRPARFQRRAHVVPAHEREPRRLEQLAERVGGHPVSCSRFRGAI